MKPTGIILLFCTTLLFYGCGKSSSEHTSSESSSFHLKAPLEETNLVSYPGRSISYSSKFRDLNPRHLAAAQKIGLNPGPQNRDAAKRMKGKLQLIQSCDNYIVDSLTHSIPYLVPTAAKRLDCIGDEFADILERNQLPHYRFHITSVLRTQDDIRRLQRSGNGNSVSNSAHNYGTTFDISYSKYDKTTRTHDYMMPDNLKLVLGQVLLNQQRAGHLYVKYEYKQCCFHITVRD